MGCRHCFGSPFCSPHFLRVPPPHSNVKKPMANPLVSIENVDLRYGGAGGTLAVSGLSLTVKKGEFVAVVGPSGCGKSTLMKLVTGLNLPNAGAVEVAGQPVTKPVSIVGMAFQNPTMLPWRTTLDNILLPLEIVEKHRGRLRAHKADYVQKAETLLATVGLKGFGAKFPWQLSGGMQQRANLCRALIHEPELLMLDEPFGALDAFTREELWCVIRDLHQASQSALQPVTIVLVTHDLREAVFLADRIFVMSARPGRIIETKTVPFERPRPLDIMYSQGFNDIVHELRALIAEARVAPQEV
jgi:NitT/TauT family transport system ATP-binding protein